MFRPPNRDVHVHVYSANCPEIGRDLIFRDRLRRNSYDRNRSDRTKREPAAKEGSVVKNFRLHNMLPATYWVKKLFATLPGQKVREE